MVPKLLCIDSVPANQKKEKKNKMKKSEWNIEIAPEILGFMSIKYLDTCSFWCRYTLYRCFITWLLTVRGFCSAFLRHLFMHLFLDHIFMMLCKRHYLWELNVYGAVLLMQPLHIHSAPCVLILSFENKLSSGLTTVSMAHCCSHSSQACQTVQCRSPGDCLIDCQE